jgi:DNA repair protein SbcC/Rad50
VRILQVRFKNLNSLAGEWQIDLAHPAFVSNGIFAITGPTGAGKTTILDAICLALYGRTPRLNKVSKSVNEVMSRQTGECFSEVTFETQSGRYRCHWSQHRARKNPNGDLQSPKHEIANADTGELFESGIRGVAGQIEAATGMDFDRFTRSMLLAQGGFAAFLQAAADERAPILEQITGTEIYSEISIRVHQRRSQEQKQHDILQAELAGMQPLSMEQEQQLGNSLAQLGKQDAELSGQLSEQNQAISWLEGITRLEDELKLLNQAKTELLARIEAFAPDKERLQLANRALELAADYAALIAIRKVQNADQCSLVECRNSLPTCTDAAQQAQAAMSKAAEQLTARKTEQQAAQPLIRKVRELDLKISGIDSPVQVSQSSVAELSSVLEALQAKQQSDSTELANHHQALDELQVLLGTSAVDEKLVEQLTGLRNRCDGLKDLAGQLESKLAESATATAQLKDALTVWQQQKTSLEHEQGIQEQNRQVLAEQQSDLLKILNGKDVAGWRLYHSALVSQQDLLSKTLEALGNLEMSQQAISRLDSQQVALGQEELTLQSALTTKIERQVAIEQEVAELETQMILLKRIGDLEEVRKQLHDGEPCPLCGARDHPFAEGNIPAPDETRQSLAAVRNELKWLTSDIAELKIRIANAGKDLERTVSAQKEHAGKIGEANRLLSDNCAALACEPKLTLHDSELPEKLKRLQQENSRELQLTTEKLAAAERIEMEIATLRDGIDKVRDSVTQREREFQTATHQLESAEHLQERLRKEASAYQQQQDKLLVTLQKDMELYGITLPDVETIDRTYALLVARRDQWVTRNR